jgi:hypothetical protein
MKKLSSHTFSSLKLITMDLENTKKSARSFVRKTLIISLVGLILAGVVYFMYRNYTVSEGTRSGTLFKMSKKGYVFKTYEGELNLAGSGIMSDRSIWKFSGADEAVFGALQALEGKQVRCHYNEKKQAFPWQGDTNYIVYKVEAVPNGQ